ncbi:hypothetical protein [uncultured Chryseobacterium sp.]|uniref:hypothetical protein n=1 Tax=uncultured Chryseobacterium sp. TaxID=259322 RepID=UPI0025FD6115|nr:hypothetical protein [uncultured Chryseobacterium sp.]
MDTLAIIGMIMMVLGFASAAWVAILYVLSLSALAGTKISKKVGTANEKTDEYIETGKAVSGGLLKKLIVRLVVGCTGWLMFYLITGHS